MVRSAAVIRNRQAVFFFFQAEDGIRDDLVTGVQTCALPICGRRSVLWDRRITRAKIELMKKTRAAGKITAEPLVGIIMGSTSDWETMEHAANTLRNLGVPYETRIVSAHRTPDLLFEYASTAERRGIEVIIAGAGGAAHLPGMAASKTVLPVLGAPGESKAP